MLYLKNGSGTYRPWVCLDLVIQTVDEDSHVQVDQNTSPAWQRIKLTQKNIVNADVAMKDLSRKEATMSWIYTSVSVHALEKDCD